MQKSIIVDGFKSNDNLNVWLEKGWVVVSLISTQRLCLVIIEKKGK